ncbi:glycogen debranching protein [Dyadobacter sp. CY326]|uniref:alpha-L-rhamnosidase-related protein n=1 Tax=Dyadobacter sp. CY326 TaxID=2907300 RepID=UPI001F31E9A9|nr:glycogen debranching protein [Dyadobacter sp. CY326]MCE7064798.1 glycogen debranching protein [Dyadobacter sp. CY326]
MKLNQFLSGCLSVLGKPFPALVAASALLFQCAQNKVETKSFQNTVSDTESIIGKSIYLNTPYITAGDRVYMVGHQDGTFPDLGWHVTGEMGGVWDHPIKLLDGFAASLTVDNKSVCLSKADTFINYPFANKHVFSTGLPGLKVERFQFVPDGKEAVVVAYTFNNKSDKKQTIQFDFNGYTDLRQVWLGEKTGMIDGNDNAIWNEANHSWMAKDSLNDWFVMFGANLEPTSHAQNAISCDYKPQGNGCTASLQYTFDIAPNASVTVPFTIAGSYQSEANARKTFEDVQANAASLLKQKKERYASIESRSKLTIPDKNLEQAFRWTKYNTDWLIRDVPEIGRGLSAGAPDYPWWFGADSEYALKGLIATGQADLVEQSVNVVFKLSEKVNGNGRIMHETSTNGAVFNPGNLNETPQFASLIAHVYRWTGDKAFLQKYFPTIKKGLSWLLKENDKDGNLLPDGFGMMEIHGMDSEMIDVAVYTQTAFADAAEMAAELGDQDLAKEYADIAGKIRAKVNSDFWVPESSSFADFIGTPKQAINLISDAIVRADTLKKPWAVAELKAAKGKIIIQKQNVKKGFVVHHNWVVNTPMEMGIADTSKALAALQTASKFVNPFGAFVTGIDRDESAGKDASSVAGRNKVFTYTGAVMTLPTGVLAIAENNYGRPDAALGYLKKMTRSFSFALPGSIYEVSPDFGMMAQAWNVYSYAYPIVQQFFGIQPHASKKLIYIQPQMPSEWNDASLDNVVVGDNELDYQFTKTGSKIELKLSQNQADWKLVIALPKGKYNNWIVNGKAVTPVLRAQFDVVEFSGKVNAFSAVLK